ncbi:hypothetical protein DFH27DRAFT_607838 [Peziza echinospora]|nr:hypothetical protein DFH27DRAFT_607838 [Peziza echinospora]
MHAAVGAGGFAIWGVRLEAGGGRGGGGGHWEANSHGSVAIQDGHANCGSRIMIRLGKCCKCGGGSRTTRADMMGEHDRQFQAGQRTHYAGVIDHSRLHQKFSRASCRGARLKLCGCSTIASAPPLLVGVLSSLSLLSGREGNCPRPSASKLLVVVLESSVLPGLAWLVHPPPIGQRSPHASLLIAPRPPSLHTLLERSTLSHTHLLGLLAHRRKPSTAQSRDTLIGLMLNEASVTFFLAQCSLKWHLAIESSIKKKQLQITIRLSRIELRMKLAAKARSTNPMPSSAPTYFLHISHL